MYLGANRFVKNMAKTDSRTSKSIKNSSVALVFYFINLILQFFSRKIFLDYLGAEVLGLNTTATNLLQFLNLAELGVGAAIVPFINRLPRKIRIQSMKSYPCKGGSIGVSHGS